MNIKNGGTIISKKEQIEALHNFVKLMNKEKSLPRDLQLTFEEIEDYILKNS